MAHQPTDPFAVKLSAEAEKELSRRLVDEIRNAKRARSGYIEDGGMLDFWWSLYEQQSQKGISRDAPRYGSADLTSPIGTENVDALAARAVKTVFLEPLWIVEGVGDSAKKAPVVEEFLQWRQEHMRLQSVAKRVFTSALVETGSIFEVCEDHEKVGRVEVVKAEILRDELGNVVLDATDGNPVAQTDERGAPIPAADQGPDAPHVEVKHTFTDYRRRGAYVRRRSMKDFLFLPSHAEDDREVWGHATRFWLRLDECQRREKAKEFRNVDMLGPGGQERDNRAEHDRRGITVEVSHGEDLIEKELWRVQFWLDIGKGLCCYIAVVSEQHDCILSLQHDWLQRWRTIYVNPYPCPYSVYGYSVIGTKLLTTIEEHTAWRNMNADRATLKSNAPIKRLHASSWDPAIQPFGAGEVIDVTNMNDVQPFEFDDVTPQAMAKEAGCVTDAQRLIGMNDIAIGQTSAKSRTLGENEMATRESFTRTDDPIGNIQEAMEELGDVLHAIEVQTLEDTENGLEAPASVAEQISLRLGDTSFGGTFMADMVSGTYRFKPRGSVEGADPNRRQQVFINGLNVLFGWAKVNQGIGMRVMSPEFGDAIMQSWVTEFKPRDKQAFLKPIQPPMLPPGPPMAPGQDPNAPPAEGGGPPMPNFGGEQLLQQLMGGIQ